LSTEVIEMNEKEYGIFPSREYFENVCLITVFITCICLLIWLKVF
jgi:hypothetical protein